MGYETPSVSAELINKAFIDKIDAGQVKEAQEAASAYIRQKLYEEGIMRRLFESRTVTPDELDPDVDSDKPRILVEKEPDAPKATYVPFKGTADRSYFEGVRFPVPFGKIESDRLNKSKFELMTIRMPIMDWLKENQVKQVQNAEDEVFIDTITGIITDNSENQAKSISGTTYNFKECFVAGLKGLTSLSLPVGKVLMNRNTYLDSLSLKTEDVGDKAQDARFERGIDNEDSFLGYPVVTTIKHDLVAENELYFFAPDEFFCKFYFLQDATLYLKTEADMIEFHTYEAPGFGIGNTLGVFKVTIT
jgi:hypothetical protein